MSDEEISLAYRLRWQIELLCKALKMHLKLDRILTIAKHTKVDMIWVTGRNPTLVCHSLRGIAMNLKATTLTYLAILLPFSMKLIVISV